MAQVDNAVTLAVKDRRKTFWTASMFSNDADTTGNLTVKAKPSDSALYVDHILIVSDADCGTISINDDATPIFGPFEVTTAEMGGVIDINLKRPIVLTGSLKVDCGTNAPINVIAEGFTVPAQGS
jgi:hypothetical protein